MAILKCKMCGGALEIGENQSVATCEYCGVQQTIPKLDNEKKLALFSRANNLRIKNEFDKATGIYESIIAEFRDESEAYWGLVLCKYGIEYVDDGKGSKIPTCHRTLPVAIMEDEDFQQACEYADITAKNIYRDEAKAIDKIQKKILNIALNEDPYDIFICYKETDDITGLRTEDSLIAQDIYTELLKDGYRVFFSRVSLREVAGTEYEPYIYAALSSAKIMLAIGTKHDYYDAVWVKNEWSRFISMMGDNSSKVLIPCFKNMDAYDMPKEFKNMQALDMGDVTFFGSLTENIERIIDKTRGKGTKETIVLNNDNVDVAPLLERGFLFLEDKDWDRADEFFEAVLNKDPKNAQAYLGELLVELKVSEFEKLSEFHTTFSDNKNYEKIMRFADSDLKENVKNCNDSIARRMEEARKKDLYENALEIMESATTEEMFENAGYMFIEVKDYADAKEKSQECFEKGEIARKDTILAEAEKNMTGNDASSYQSAIKLLEEIPGWKNADEKILVCRKRIEEIKIKEEADRIERERRGEEERIERERAEEEKRKASEEQKKKIKKLTMIISPIVAILIVFVIVLNTVIIPDGKYNEAVALMEAGKYEEAIATFEVLEGHKDSVGKINECKYAIALNLMDAGNIEEAYKELIALDGYKDSTEISKSIYDKYITEKLKTLKVGDNVFFGAYEQDNNISDGKEPIEWLVLEVKDNKTLVISKYGLDCKKYNTSFTAVTWETCSLRKWLNNNFINSAFSDDEKEMIPAVIVSADKNPEYSTNPGNETQDKIFLLSMTEANKYFDSDSARECKPTDYAVDNGVYVENFNGNCLWWLRSPGMYQKNATCVGTDGGVYPGGDVDVNGVYYKGSNRAVRPVMWIEIA